MNRKGKKPSGADKRFKCEQCEKWFGHKGQFNTHMVIHQGVKPHSCSTCNKSFTRLGNLNAHMLMHQGLKPHSCSTCHKSFSQLGNLQMHQKTVHEGKRDFICSTCSIGFGQKCNLVRHERVVHQGRRDHACTTCGKIFGDKEEKNHEQTQRPKTSQTRNEPNVENETQSQCLARTTELRSPEGKLLRHRRVAHEGRKDHACKNCADLTRHMLTHGNERPFSCNDCNKKFNCKSNLRRHKAKACIAHQQKDGEDSNCN